MNLLVLAGLTLLVTLALRRAFQRHIRREAAADPQLSEARRAGFALTNSINSSDMGAAALEAARTVRGICRELDLPQQGLARGRLEVAVATAESAAEHAAVQARTIRFHRTEIMRAAGSSSLKMKLLDLAGSEAMEYLHWAQDAASALDEAAREARRAVIEARARR